MEEPPGWEVQREEEVNWPVAPSYDSVLSPRPERGDQQGKCRWTGSIFPQTSLPKAGLRPPVSAWSLPWANNDRNAC